eukprot:SAG11_NODE_6985_length_1214_cov_1.258296_1_plen_199_part_00
MPRGSSKASYSEADQYSDEEQSEAYTASDAESDEGEEEEWTNDHLKLLYMISKYAECALTPDDDEGWIRKNSLLVLMYEGIVAHVFDYDYAPMSLLVGRKRVWLNISQEGKDDIDDLREGGLLNGLKLSSEDLQPITAYQVSEKGKELAILVPREFRTVSARFVSSQSARKCHRHNSAVKILTWCCAPICRLCRKWTN